MAKITRNIEISNIRFCSSDLVLLCFLLYLQTVMTRFLKYLILSIVAVALCEASGVSVASSSYDGPQCPVIENLESSSFLSETDDDLCLPRQISYASATRLQSSIRRTDNVHRSSFEFVKAGSVINLSVRGFVQNHFTLVHSSLEDTLSRLASLGRLII